MFGVFLFLLYAVLTAVLVVGSWRLRFALTHFRMAHAPKKLSGDAVPTVSICIPARNEDHALTDCLQQLLESTYEKQEIIVLDDMSGDNTSALIKSFASEGIRFVEGSAIPAGWQGKNHALQGLLEEASGDYILFMDVDTRLKPDSVERLVAYALEEDAAMVSVLPRREDGWRSSVIFPTLRYLWEVLFHRNDAPAAASNAWLINRQVLREALGGFEPYKADIQPESQLAATLMRAGKYRFVMGTEALGISYEKKWRSQLATSIRLLYPLLGGKISHAVIAGLDLLVIVSPLFIVLAGFFVGWGIHQVIAGIVLVLYAVLYALYLRSVSKRGWWLAACVWPALVIQEVVLLVLSVVGYQRGTITWKNRRVKA